MSLSSSDNLVKYMLFGFNFIFVITGIILLSVGATVQGVFHGYSHFLESKFFSVAAFLMAIGIIIFIIAFFGCCGAIRENYCMILTFAVLMVFVFILEMAAGISGYVLRNQTKDLIRTQLQSTMVNFVVHPKDNIEMVTLWDHVQQSYSCCGLDSYENWANLTENTEKLVPVSCCEPIPGAMGSVGCDPAKDVEAKRLFPDGCVSSFGAYIMAHAVSLGAAGVAICVIQFLGIFMACYLARQVKNKQGGHSGFQ